jgi:hypothetical protein
VTVWVGKEKRFSTEEKIQMLREADTGRIITELCRRKNISEATLHRWKREFGMMEINEARSSITSIPGGGRAKPDWSRGWTNPIQHINLRSLPRLLLGVAREGESDQICHRPP